MTSTRTQAHSRPLSVRRRTVLRGTLLGGMLAITAAQAACSTGSPDSATPPSTPTDPPPDTGPATPTASSDSSGSATGPTSASVLLVYFSRAGENYYYGDRIDLDVGNTEVLSRIISQRLHEAGVAHDVHRVEATDPYPEDYDATDVRNVREQDADTRPSIANPLDSIDDYDVILSGSPIWNVRPPMIMHTFAESHDFTGKTVYPFTTHAMSGLGTAERDYTTACAGATIGQGRAVQGEGVREAGPPAVAAWLARIGLA